MKRLALTLCLLMASSAFAQQSNALELAIAQTWQPMDVHVVWVPVFGDPAVLAEWTEINVESTLPDCALGLLTVTLSGKTVEGKSVRATFKGRARVFGDSWTVATRVKIGDPVFAENLVRLDCEWSNLRTTVLLDSGAIVGKLAVRALIPGRPILDADVRTPSVIRSGDPVTLVFEQSGIKVLVDGVAMKAGGIGEKIPVRVPEVESNRLVGVIQNDHTLRWVP